LAFNKGQFHKERELLLRELATVKKQKQDLEELLLNRSVELTRTKESLAHLAGDSTLHSERLRRDNLQLRAELNEAKSHLIARDHLVKEMQAQLSEPSLLRRANELGVNSIEFWILI
jgi:hypothetical protein